MERRYSRKSSVEEDSEPSLFRELRGDYLNLPSQPYLMNIIKGQGDTVYFADKVLKFTNSGKIKRRILVITDSAVYIIDPETNALKHRITLAAVEMICLSKLSDNFFAVIIPTEYDLLMTSMRKTEIVTALLRSLFSKCPLIRNSAKLKRIMQTILSPGNALNQGTANSNILHSYSSEFVSSRILRSICMFFLLGSVFLCAYLEGNARFYGNTVACWLPCMPEELLNLYVRCPALKIRVYSSM